MRWTPARAAARAKRGRLVLLAPSEIVPFSHAVHEVERGPHAVQRALDVGRDADVPARPLDALHGSLGGRLPPREAAHAPAGGRELRLDSPPHEAGRAGQQDPSFARFAHL
jgi:hypothetical protein